MGSCFELQLKGEKHYVYLGRILVFLYTKQGIGYRVLDKYGLPKLASFHKIGLKFFSMAIHFMSLSLLI